MQYPRMIASILLITFVFSPLMAEEDTSPQYRKSYVQSMRLQATSENRNKITLGASSVATTAYGASHFLSSRRAAILAQDQAALNAAQNINQSGELLAEEIRQGHFPKDPKATISVIQEMSREDFTDLVARAQEEKAQLTREIQDLEKRSRLLHAQLAKGEVTEVLVQTTDQELEFKKSARMTYAQIIKKKPEKIANLKGAFLRTDFKKAQEAQAYIEQLARQKIPTAASLDLAKGEAAFKRAKLGSRAWGALSLIATAYSAYNFLQLEFEVEMLDEADALQKASR